MRLLYAFGLILFSCLLTSASGAEGLTVYSEYHRPKEVIVGSKGGLIHDEVAELLRRAGMDDTVTIVTWKRGYAEATERPNVGLFPTTRTKEREPLFHWIGPILRVKWVFYAHADSGIVINSLEDARKVQRIGTYASDGKEQWLKKQGFTNLVSVMENQLNVHKLYDRRIDLMVGSPTVTDRWPETMGYDPEKFVPAYTFNTVDLYLALSKDTPQDTAERLQKIFNEMLADGTIRALYEKWVPGLTPPDSE